MNKTRNMIKIIFTNNGHIGLEKNIKIEKQFEKEKQKNIIINRTRILHFEFLFFQFLAHDLFFYDAIKIQEKLIG